MDTLDTTKNTYHFLTRMPAFTAHIIKQKMITGNTPTDKELRELAEVEVDVEKHKHKFIDFAKVYINTLFDDWELYSIAKVYYPQLPPYPGLKRNYLLELLDTISEEQKFWIGRHIFENYRKKYKGFTFIVKNPYSEAKVVGYLGVEIIDPKLTARLRIAVDGDSKFENGKIAKSLYGFIDTIYSKQLYEQGFKYLTFTQLKDKHKAIIDRFNGLQENKSAHFKLTGTTEYKRYNNVPMYQQWYRLNLYSKFPREKKVIIKQEQPKKDVAKKEVMEEIT